MKFDNVKSHKIMNHNKIL